MKRVLVTGARGYVAPWAIAALHQAGFDVHGTSSIRGVRVRNATLHYADLLDGDIAGLIGDVQPTHLLLAAWVTKHREFWESPDNDGWLAANVSIAERFFAKGGRRLVFAGSCAAYDWSDSILRNPVKEDAAQGAPLTRYGRAKREAAARIAALARQAGASFADGRIFFPVGMQEAPARLIPSLIVALREGRNPGLRNPALVRDFIDVRDAGAALAVLLDSAVEGAVNIGSGHGIRLDAVAAKLAAMLDRQDVLRYQPPGELGTEPPVLVADISRLTNEVGFTPRYSLDQTLASAISAVTQSRATEA